MGTLSVVDGNGQQWSKSGNQGNSWKGPVTVTLATARFKFEGVRGNGYWSDIALDTVKVTCLGGPTVAAESCLRVQGERANINGNYALAASGAFGAGAPTMNHHFVRADGGMVIRPGSATGWDFCPAVAGVVAWGACTGSSGRAGFMGDDGTGKPSTGEVFDWGGADDSHISYSCDPARTFTLRTCDVSWAGSRHTFDFILVGPHANATVSLSDLSLNAVHTGSFYAVDQPTGIAVTGPGSDGLCIDSMSVDHCCRVATGLPRWIDTPLESSYGGGHPASTAYAWALTAASQTTATPTSASPTTASGAAEQ